MLRLSTMIIRWIRRIGLVNIMRLIIRLNIMRLIIGLNIMKLIIGLSICLGRRSRLIAVLLCLVSIAIRYRLILIS